MNLVPIRTAVIAGTCAIALSFVAVPAFAAEPADSGAVAATSTTADPTPAPSDSTDPASDPSDTTDPAPDPSATTDTTDPVSDTDGTDGTDAGDDAGDDMDSTDPTPAPTETVAPLPAEQGTPTHHLKDGELTPRDVVKKGIRVEYRGLTPHAAYQPYFTTGQSGGPIGDTRKADGKGRLAVIWHPASSLKSSFAHAGAQYSIGLMGTTTQLSLLDDVTVGYDSDLVWAPAKRHGGTVTLEVRADHGRSTGSKDVAWKKVRVEFQKKVGDRWVTVTTKHTDTEGVAKVTFVAGKNVWRAVVESKGTVLGSTTKGHKK